MGREKAGGKQVRLTGSSGPNLISDLSNNQSLPPEIPMKRTSVCATKAGVTPNHAAMLALDMRTK